MCDIMSDHPDAIRVSKDNTKELIEEIRKVHQSSTNLEEMGNHILSPSLIRKVSWYHAFMLLLSFVSTLTLFALYWYASANYVGRDYYDKQKETSEVRYDSAWDKQVGINEGFLAQLQKLQISDAINQKRLDDLDQQTKELKNIIKKK